MEALFAEIHPVFQKNDHTAAELLLYPQGFQQDTPSADHEIFTALAGDPFKPGIQGFLPELSAGLYITNGDFTDWAYNTQDDALLHPGGHRGRGPGRVRVRVPRLAAAGPAGVPAPPPVRARPREVGATTRRTRTRTSTTRRTTSPSTRSRSPTAIPQPVGAVVKRELGKVKMRFQVNGGKAKTVATAEYEGGERYYKDPGVFYHRVRGVRLGHQARRRGRGVVHGRRQEVEALHLRGRGRERATRC